VLTTKAPRLEVGSLIDVDETSFAEAAAGQALMGQESVKSEIRGWFAACSFFQASDSSVISC
jgi:hypothetical protein